jgi:hypothetical protein
MRSTFVEIPQAIFHVTKVEHANLARERGLLYTNVPLIHPTKVLTLYKFVVESPQATLSRIIWDL